MAITMDPEPESDAGAGLGAVYDSCSLRVSSCSGPGRGYLSRRAGSGSEMLIIIRGSNSSHRHGPGEDPDDAVTPGPPSSSSLVLPPRRLAILNIISAVIVEWILEYREI